MQTGTGRMFRYRSPQFTYPLSGEAGLNLINFDNQILTRVLMLVSLSLPRVWRCGAATVS